jgi:nucleotide-binding universal stress UspA family protein
MRDRHTSSPYVVIGIDGSRSALRAALWAVDEAVGRNAPLQLMYAIDSSERDPGEAAPEIAAAENENALRDAFAAIKLTGKPAKTEAEIVHGPPIPMLLEASRSAAMVCVGSTGLKHAVQGRIGSTASALVASADCPVAVVPISAAPAPAGCVLAVVGESAASSAVLGLAISEARLRGAPLRVLTAWPPQVSGVRHGDKADAANHVAPARLERCLAPWRRSHPDVDIQPIAGHGSVVNYLEHLHRNAEPVQLLVVDPRRAGPSDVLLGPSGRAALDATRCILLICDRRRWL